jgi:hypothetical protein
MQVIVPAAGLSTRFPNMRPKYTLTDYQGRFMIQRAIERLDAADKIYIGVLAEHHAAYPIDQRLQEIYGDRVEMIVLPGRTLGPADTAQQIMERVDLDSSQGLLIKDCDSFFDHNHDEGNYVCVSSVADHDVIKRLAAKSFVRCNDQDIVTDIIEKQVVSDLFCVGGYHFRTPDLFREAYQELDMGDHEIFVSHVIQRLLEQGEIFLARRVRDYVDVGTAADWQEYNNKSVIFCDIDGTLVHAQPQDKHHEPAVPLMKNLDRLLTLQSQGHQFVFTTARPKNSDHHTHAMLTRLGFRDYELVSGLLNARRILINDYNDANPWPRAEAINLRRDTESLGDFL